MKAKKLIEVALPIKEISEESVRDKSIRHGHISTLHLWWARRPLSVCRAIVFASFVQTLKNNNLKIEVKFTAKNTVGNLLTENSATIKSIKESASQLGLNFEVVE